MSVIKLQRRLLGGVNRIDWRADDWARLARHFNYDGPISPLLTRRNAGSLLVTMPEPEIRTEGSMRVYEWTISTEGVDHMFDKLIMRGWDLSVFLTNPVVQFSHNGDALPIGRSLWTGIDGGALKTKMVFASDSFAQRVRRAADERVIRAASVGFKPGEWEFAKDPKRPGGINFTSGHMLLEWSICNVPANSQCLLGRVEEVKSLSDIAIPKQTPRLDAVRATLAAARSEPLFAAEARARIAAIRRRGI